MLYSAYERRAYRKGMSMEYAVWSMGYGEQTALSHVKLLCLCSLEWIPDVHAKCKSESECDCEYEEAEL